MDADPNIFLLAKIMVKGRDNLTGTIKACKNKGFTVHWVDDRGHSFRNFWDYKAVNDLYNRTGDNYHNNGTVLVLYKDPVDILIEACLETR